MPAAARSLWVVFPLTVMLLIEPEVKVPGPTTRFPVMVPEVSVPVTLMIVPPDA